MRRQTDAVTQPMTEVLAVAGRSDHVAGDDVNLPAARPRPSAMAWARASIAAC